MDALAPFYRHDGRPVPLITSEYAARAGISPQKAGRRLREMWVAGVLDREFARQTMIYEVKQ